MDFNLWIRKGNEVVGTCLDIRAEGLMQHCSPYLGCAPFYTARTFLAVPSSSGASKLLEGTKKGRKERESRRERARPATNDQQRTAQLRGIFYLILFLENHIFFVFPPSFQTDQKEMSGNLKIFCLWLIILLRCRLSAAFHGGKEGREEYAL